jgi:GT2 family glycosyltransferase
MRRMTAPPRVGAVLLSMGNRPAELERALATLHAQEGVELDVVLVGNGWEPTGLPSWVRTVHAPENLGVPEGRNVGAREVRGDYLLFYDDDAELPAPDVLLRLVRALEAHPGAGIAQPRATDPTGRPTPSRWVPRLGAAGDDRPGRVGGVWEGVFLIRRDAFDAAGGWPGRFFYAHEGIELVWQVYDAGYHAWYAADVVVHHPATSPTRHAVYYRMNARNRVWVARRNLPLPLAVLHVAVWFAISMLRIRDHDARRTWLAGLREGLTTPAGPRRPIRWSTALRLTAAGRPPVL